MSKAVKTTKKKSLSSKLPLFIIIVLIVWIPIRSGLIEREGPQIVKKVEAYKSEHGAYPVSLEQIGVKSIFNPYYFRISVEELRKVEPKEKNIQTDEFFLNYSIFVFARRCYSSRRGEWYGLD